MKILYISITAYPISIFRERFDIIKSHPPHRAYATGLSSCHESMDTQPSPLVRIPTATMLFSQ